MPQIGFGCLAFHCEEMGPWILTFTIYKGQRIVTWLLTNYGLSHLWINPLTGEKSFTSAFEKGDCVF